MNKYKICLYLLHKYIIYVKNIISNAIMKFISFCNSGLSLFEIMGSLIILRDINFFLFKILIHCVTRCNEIFQF